jgi:cytochrome P450
MHFCMGAMLSRLEMRIAFSEILTRWEDLSVAVPESTLRHRAHFSHRGLEALPLRVNRRP